MRILTIGKFGGGRRRQVISGLVISLLVAAAPLPALASSPANATSIANRTSKQAASSSLTITTNQAGKGTMEIKGLSNNQTITIKDAEKGKKAHYQSRRIKLKKGIITRCSITLAKGEKRHSFLVEGYLAHPLHFTLVRPASSTGSHRSSK